MFLRRALVAFPCSRRLFGTNNAHDVATTIAEMNQEMASVFGEPPSSGFAGSGSGSLNNDFVMQEPKTKMSSGDEMNQIPTRLTHVGNKGEAQMVDVSSKEASKRVAVASCKVILGKKVFDMVLANQMAKGDVLTVAKIAGINGAKHTSTLIPLCHNIPLTRVRVDLLLNPDDYSVQVEGEAASTGKTGVEMEAMTAVTIAGLTVYDMCKAASKEIQITDVRLLRKSGGNSGYWSRGD